MMMRLSACATALAFLLAHAPLPAAAQGAPRYVLLSERDLSRMPPDIGGRLNLRIDSTRMANITEGENVILFRVGEILPGSAFAGSRLVPGDEIFALNGYEFRDGASYAAYVHALPGSGRPVLDYVEHGTGRLMRIAGLQPAPRGYANAPARPGKDISGNGAAIALGVIGVAAMACWLTSCLSGGGSSSTSLESSGGTSQRPPGYRYEPVPERYDPPAKPDTSVGCAWGDRAYRTCR